MEYTDMERRILDMWPKFEEEVPMNNFMGEIWKPVAGFDGKYEVSNCGRVRSIDHEVKSLGGWRTVKGCVLKQRVEHGYCRVQLSIDKSSHPHKQVHRLVAEAFVPNPENKPEVNHIDGCKTNNCSDNLEWVTSSENSIHALENGLQSHKSDEEMQKMWEASSKPVIRDDGEWYASASKAAESIGAERSSVAKAIRRGSSIYGHTFRYADKLKRPIQSVLDADGVEIKVGDTVYGVGRSQHSFDVIDPHHIDPEVGETFSVRCYDRDEGEECHCRPELLTHKQPVRDMDGVLIEVGDTVWHEDGSEQLVEEMNRYGVRCFDGDKRRTFDPKYLTHTRPDSWERLERDAKKSICDYFGSSSSPDSLCEDGCPGLNSSLNCGVLMKLDLIIRAKALAEKEAAR